MVVDRDAATRPNGLASPWRTVVAAVVALPGGAALTAASAVGALRLLPEATAPGGDPAAALTGLAATLAALICGWLTSCLLLMLLSALPGSAGELVRRCRDVITPLVVRRWAAIVLGASATAGVLPGTAAASVHADPAPGWSAEVTSTSVPSTVPAGEPAPTEPPEGSTQPSTSPWTQPGRSGPTQQIPAPGWTPARPAAPPGADSGLLTGHPRSTHAEPGSVVVVAGDSLWTIAAAHLGQEATDTEVAGTWPRWYAANREAIGPDPHRLLPGTRLVVPPEAEASGP